MAPTSSAARAARPRHQRPSDRSAPAAPSCAMESVRPREAINAPFLTRDVNEASTISLNIVERPR
ncbi:hypothetical protein EK403_19790 [Hansschlegelia zhihuaiae]|uniref:Uncharacterized protein n=1 Tax=Hansschlegelia zhihuaiae TaxID=405005 RepID=A0A4Q0M681_9HYPH|nr:hypothetical protein EK403_19790 [Hansschlegelia zhihuaiae]